MKTRLNPSAGKDAFVAGLHLFGNEGRAAMSVEKLVEHFAAIEDPRCAGKVEHRLIDILVIAVCAVIACAESWDAIALYGRSKLTWLQSFLLAGPRHSLARHLPARLHAD